jgi:hypothetical protein
MEAMTRPAAAPPDEVDTLIARLRYFAQNCGDAENCRLAIDAYHMLRRQADALAAAPSAAPSPAPADGLAARLHSLAIVFDHELTRGAVESVEVVWDARMRQGRDAFLEAAAALSQVRTDARDAEIAKLREERGTYLGTHHDGKWHPSPTGVIVGQLDTELSASRREVAALRETVLTIVGKWCKRGEILLAMGELTPSELRCVQAATRSIDRQVRAALAEGKQT